MIFDTSQPLSKLYSRRDFLRAALAAGVLPILPRLVRAASPVRKRLVAGTRVLEVNGRPLEGRYDRSGGAPFVRGRPRPLRTGGRRRRR